MSNSRHKYTAAKPHIGDLVSVAVYGVGVGYGINATIHQALEEGRVDWYRIFVTVMLVALSAFNLRERSERIKRSQELAHHAGWMESFLGVKYEQQTHKEGKS